MVICVLILARAHHRRRIIAKVYVRFIFHTRQQNIMTSIYINVNDMLRIWNLQYLYVNLCSILAFYCG